MIHEKEKQNGKARQVYFKFKTRGQRNNESPKAVMVSAGEIASKIMKIWTVV